MLDVNKENYEAQVLQEQGLVVVDFWSPKCEPCMELMPAMNDLSERYGAVKFCKLNILENRRLAISQRVLGLPTIVIYKDGERVAVLSRDFSIEDVESQLKDLLG